MKNTVISYMKSENGSGVLAVSVGILVVLSLLGIMAMTTTNMDMLITGNSRRYKENFYVGEGGCNTEQYEIGQGSYPVVQTNIFDQVVGRDDALSPNQDLPPGSAGQDIDRNGNVVLDNAFNPTFPTGDYEFDITYIGKFMLPPKSKFGTNFKRFDYGINTFSDPGEVNLRVTSRCYKVGLDPDAT